jgi:hypothetical protein
MFFDMDFDVCVDGNFQTRLSAVVLYVWRQQRRITAENVSVTVKILKRKRLGMIFLGIPKRI